MKIKRLALLMLCAVMILTSAVIPTVFTAKAAEPINDYNYSNPASDRNLTLTAAEFLTDLGYTLSDAEADYLNAFCDFKLRYDRVSQDMVEKRVTGADGEPKKVEIQAQYYTYTAVDGSSVITWTPVKAEIVMGDTVICSATSYTEESGKRIFTIENVDVDLSYDYRVQYQISDGITVFADDVNLLLDYAYDEITKVQSHLDFYESNADAVNASLGYLKDKRIWDQKKAAYDAYPQRLEKYGEDLDKYKKYRDVTLPEYLRLLSEYNTDLNNYNQELKLYNEYLAKLDTMKAQIDTFDTALTKKMTYLDREVYACFFASLVDEVVARKEELIAGFGEKMRGPIDNSKAATENIRKIFRPSDGTHYDKLESIDDKYTFYINNYEALCANIYLLTESLYKIYTTNGMLQLMHTASSMMHREDYTERLAIFIAQLVGLCDVLSDTPLTYTSGQGKEHSAANMSFNYRTKAGADVKNRTISQIFEGEEFVKDTNNATPIAPPAKVDPPTPMTSVPPVEPEEIIEPTKPVQPADPGNPPTEVFKPDGMPEGGFDWTRFISDTSYHTLMQTLLAEKLGGVLTDRDDVLDINYVPTYNVQKPFDDSSYIKIGLYDANRELIDRIEIKKGSDVDFRALGYSNPVKAEDISATYTFIGWESADGQPFDYSATRDVDLYPVFEVNHKDNYEIDGKKLVATTDGDLVRLPIVKFAEIVDSEQLEGLKAMARDVGIEIKYESLLELRAAGVDYLVARADFSNAASPVCQVLAYTDGGNRVEISSPITVYLAFADLKSDVTYTDLNNESNKAGTESVKLSSDAESNTNYIYFQTALNKSDTLSVKYDISCTSSVQAPTTAAPGETVSIDITDVLGMRAEAYYMHNGVKYAISGKSFVMPEGSVQLGVSYTDIICTVTFISNGKEIKKDSYKWGSPLDKWPSNPTKANDSEYSYKFKRWSPLREDFVYEDLVYIAIFERTPLPKEPIKINWLRVLVVTAMVLVVTGFVALVLLILHKTKVINVKKIIPAICSIFKKKGDKGTDVIADSGEVQPPEECEKTPKSDEADPEK